MKMLRYFLLALVLAQPLFAQSNPPIYQGDCFRISTSFFMCDDVQDWNALQLPEDLEGAGAKFDNGIRGIIEIMESPWVGIQVRAQRYVEQTGADFIAEALTKIDGFPAITYIFQTERDGRATVEARTELRLYQISIFAITYQRGTEYTTEHAARHAKVLAGMTHEWSFN